MKHMAHKEVGWTLIHMRVNTHPMVKPLLVTPRNSRLTQRQSKASTDNLQMGKAMRQRTIKTHNKTLHRLIRPTLAMISQRMLVLPPGQM